MRWSCDSHFARSTSSNSLDSRQGKIEQDAASWFQQFGIEDRIEQFNFRRYRCATSSRIGEKSLDGSMRMPSCCDRESRKRSVAYADRIRSFLNWLVPCALLLFMPKCPVCFAAYTLLWTGIGISVGTAGYIRWMLIGMCIASIGLLIYRKNFKLNSILRNRFTTSFLNENSK